MKKNTSIRTAEKLSIKSEIRTHKYALRKVKSDCKQERVRLNRGIKKAGVMLVRLDKTEDRESTAILRRLAILDGRL